MRHRFSYQEERLARYLRRHAVTNDHFDVVRRGEEPRDEPAREASGSRRMAVAPRPPVLGFTTHALARETQPLHGRCTRVVTKETLTQELPELLKTGVPA